MSPVSVGCSVMFGSGLGKRVQITIRIVRYVADCQLKDQNTPFQLRRPRRTLWGNCQDRVQDRQRNIWRTI